VCPSPSLDEYRRGKTEKADCNEITDEFASKKAHKVSFSLECYSTYTRKGWILCLSNTSNTYYALRTLLYHPNYMYFIKKNCRLQLQYVVEFFCRLTICQPILLLQASFPVTTHCWTENKLAEISSSLRQSELIQKVTANQNWLLSQLTRLKTTSLERPPQVTIKTTSLNVSKVTRRVTRHKQKSHVANTTRGNP